MSARQIEILRRLWLRRPVFAGVPPKQRGVVARDLLRLYRKGWLRRRGGSMNYLTKKAIALLESAGG